MMHGLIIYDEKLSSKNQCETLIGNLKKKHKIKYDCLIVKKKIIHYLPNSLIFIFLKLIYYFNKKRNKKYNFIISCGRITAPYNLILSKNNHVQSYHILDPYFGRKFFTNIIIPYHDQQKLSIFKNIIFTVGSFSKLPSKKGKKMKEKKK